ncbi:MAG: cation-transporting P-type ATPase [Bacteroidetes bacterium]|nr:cation-transporting P-type ATPase [Fibrella sp.]
METELKTPPEQPQAIAADQLTQTLGVDPATGLTDDEARQRLAKDGPNALPDAERESWVTILARQFKGVIVWVLVGAAVVSFAFGDTVEGFAIVIVLLINAITGFVLELNARQSMDSLRKMDVSPARVLRGGQVREISSEELTVGDVLLVEAGEVVGADANLFDFNQLEVDESALTGESLPASKNTEMPPADAPLGDQHNRLFKGTAVTAGNGRAVITGIGQQTELGKVAKLVEGAEKSATPLDEKLDSLAKVLIWIVAGLAGLFLVLGLIRGEEVKQLLQTAVALAIAAIPEGMSVVATIALAYGMLRLAEQKVIVKRLSSVETLGGTNVIFTDKTGTLTQNRIDVQTVQLPDDRADIRPDANAGTLAITNGEPGIVDKETYKMLVRVSILCNNAEFHPHQDTREVGDPLEVALLKFAYGSAIDPDAVRKQFPRQTEKAFSSDTRVMGTLHQADGHQFAAVKGAVEEILTRCPAMDEPERAEQQAVSEKMAADGLRTLAFAYRDIPDKAGDDFADHDLIYTGLIGFLDPPRLEVAPALDACRQAGIKVIMVTGDHPETALTIARQVHLIQEGEAVALTGRDLKPLDQESDQDKEKVMQCRVFARVSPGQKLDLIDRYQQQGDVVGMTGDGVNDAPALKKSDIGIAMGMRGSQVAVEAADMVLKDDLFTSIVTGISQGRVIFENIRKFVMFLISCNLSEILVVTVAGILNMGNPLLPLQILFINIITDVFPALALGVGRDNRELMKQPPRDPKTPLMTTRDWRVAAVYALVMAGAVLGVYIYGTRQLGLSQPAGNTITFYSLALAQILHVFNLYSGEGRPSFRMMVDNEITRNRFVWIATTFCILVLVLTYYVPFLREALSLQPLSISALELIVLAGIVPLLVLQTVRKLTGWGAP